MRMLRPWVLAFGFVVNACGSASADPPRTPVATRASDAHATAAAARAPSSRATGAPLSTASMGDTEAIAREQRATEQRDERFSVQRQVAALERSVLLYREFIERAGDDPRYAEAVKRSRERIRDATDTLLFLREDASGH